MHISNWVDDFEQEHVHTYMQLFFVKYGEQKNRILKESIDECTCLAYHLNLSKILLHIAQ